MCDTGSNIGNRSQPLGWVCVYVCVHVAWSAMAAETIITSPYVRSCLTSNKWRRLIPSLGHRHLSAELSSMSHGVTAVPRSW